MTKLLFTLLIIISFLPITGNANSNNFIKIDKIKLNASVVNATGTMEQNALLMDNSAINQGSELCSSGNAYIAGHSSPTKRKQKAGKVFANLHKLKRGDIVSTTNCKYEIRSITIITGKANKNGISYRFTSAQANFVKENTFNEGTLTLQTCTRKLGQILVVKAIKL
jgi:sortase (surface protein transpeptidase)